MTLLIIIIVLDILVGVMASSRGRSGFGFFLLSFLLSPLIGLVILLCVRNIAAEDRIKAEKAEADRRHEETIAAIIASGKKD
ncbi:hypothetical protein ACVOZ6_003541 [Escherichia coli]